eukprot:g5733.t1
MIIRHEVKPNYVEYKPPPFTVPWSLGTEYCTLRETDGDVKVSWRQGCAGAFGTTHSISGYRWVPEPNRFQVLTWVEDGKSTRFYNGAHCVSKFTGGSGAPQWDGSSMKGYVEARDHPLYKPFFEQLVQGGTGTTSTARSGKSSSVAEGDDDGDGSDEEEEQQERKNPLHSLKKIMSKVKRAMKAQNIDPTILDNPTQLFPLNQSSEGKEKQRSEPIPSTFVVGNYVKDSRVSNIKFNESRCINGQIARIMLFKRPLADKEVGLLAQTCLDEYPIESEKGVHINVFKSSEQTRESREKKKSQLRLIKLKKKQKENRAKVIAEAADVAFDASECALEAADNAASYAVESVWNLLESRRAVVRAKTFLLEAIAQNCKNIQPGCASSRGGAIIKLPLPSSAVAKAIEIELDAKETLKEMKRKGRINYKPPIMFALLPRHLPCPQKACDNPLIISGSRWKFSAVLKRKEKKKKIFSRTATIERFQGKFGSYKENVSKLEDETNMYTLVAAIGQSKDTGKQNSKKKEFLVTDTFLNCKSCFKFENIALRQRINNDVNLPYLGLYNTNAGRGWFSTIFQLDSMQVQYEKHSIHDTTTPWRCSLRSLMIRSTFNVIDMESGADVQFYIRGSDGTEFPISLQSDGALVNVYQPVMANWRWLEVLVILGNGSFGGFNDTEKKEKEKENDNNDDGDTNDGDEDINIEGEAEEGEEVKSNLSSSIVTLAAKRFKALRSKALQMRSVANEREGGSSPGCQLFPFAREDGWSPFLHQKSAFELIATTVLVDDDDHPRIDHFKNTFSENERNDQKSSTFSKEWVTQLDNSAIIIEPKLKQGAYQWRAPPHVPGSTRLLASTDGGKRWLSLRNFGYSFNYIDLSNILQNDIRPSIAHYKEGGTIALRSMWIQRSAIAGPTELIGPRVRLCPYRKTRKIPKLIFPSASSSDVIDASSFRSGALLVERNIRKDNDESDIKLVNPIGAARLGFLFLGDEKKSVGRRRFQFSKQNFAGGISFHNFHESMQSQYPNGVSWSRTVMGWNAIVNNTIIGTFATEEEAARTVDKHSSQKQMKNFPIGDPIYLRNNSAKEKMKWNRFLRLPRRSSHICVSSPSNLFALTDNFTIESWIRPSFQLPSNEMLSPIFSKWNECEGKGWEICLGRYAASFRLRIGGDKAIQLCVEMPTTALQNSLRAGKWIYICATYDGKWAKLQLNGRSSKVPVHVQRGIGGSATVILPAKVKPTHAKFPFCIGKCSDIRFPERNRFRGDFAYIRLLTNVVVRVEEQACFPFINPGCLDLYDRFTTKTMEENLFLKKSGKKIAKNLKSKSKKFLKLNLLKSGLGTLQIPERYVPSGPYYLSFKLTKGDLWVDTNCIIRIYKSSDWSNALRCTNKLINGRQIDSKVTLKSMKKLQLIRENPQFNCSPIGLALNLPGCGLLDPNLPVGDIRVQLQHASLLHLPAPSFPLISSYLGDLLTLGQRAAAIASSALGKKLRAIFMSNDEKNDSLASRKKGNEIRLRLRVLLGEDNSKNIRAVRFTHVSVGCEFLKNKSNNGKISNMNPNFHVRKGLHDDENGTVVSFISCLDEKTKKKKKEFEWREMMRRRKMEEIEKNEEFEKRASEFKVEIRQMHDTNASKDDIAYAIECFEDEQTRFLSNHKKKKKERKKEMYKFFSNLEKENQRIKNENENILIQSLDYQRIEAQKRLKNHPSKDIYSIDLETQAKIASLFWYGDKDKDGYWNRKECKEMKACAMLPRMDIYIGARVESNYLCQLGEQKFYGKICSINPNGTYDIIYDDDDEIEMNVIRKHFALKRKMKKSNLSSYETLCLQYGDDPLIGLSPSSFSLLLLQCGGKSFIDALWQRASNQKSHVPTWKASVEERLLYRNTFFEKKQSSDDLSNFSHVNINQIQDFFHNFRLSKNDFRILLDSVGDNSEKLELTQTGLQSVCDIAGLNEKEKVDFLEFVNILLRKKRNEKDDNESSKNKKEENVWNFSVSAFEIDSDEEDEGAMITPHEMDFIIKERKEKRELQTLKNIRRKGDLAKFQFSSKIENNMSIFEIEVRDKNDKSVHSIYSGCQLELIEKNPEFQNFVPNSEDGNSKFQLKKNKIEIGDRVILKDENIPGVLSRVHYYHPLMEDDEFTEDCDAYEETSNDDEEENSKKSKTAKNFKTLFFEKSSSPNFREREIEENRYASFLTEQNNFQHVLDWKSSGKDVGVVYDYGFNREGCWCAEIQDGGFVERLIDVNVDCGAQLQLKCSIHPIEENDVHFKSKSNSPKNSSEKKMKPKNNKAIIEWIVGSTVFQSDSFSLDGPSPVEEEAILLADKRERISKSKSRIGKPPESRSGGKKYWREIQSSFTRMAITSEKKIKNLDFDTGKPLQLAWKKERSSSLHDVFQQLTVAHQPLLELPNLLPLSSGSFSFRLSYAGQPWVPLTPPPYIYTAKNVFSNSMYSPGVGPDCGGTSLSLELNSFASREFFKHFSREDCIIEGFLCHEEKYDLNVGNLDVKKGIFMHFTLDIDEQVKGGKLSFNSRIPDANQSEANQRMMNAKSTSLLIAKQCKLWLRLPNIDFNSETNRNEWFVCNCISGDTHFILYSSQLIKNMMTVTPRNVLSKGGALLSIEKSSLKQSRLEGKKKEDEKKEKEKEKSTLKQSSVKEKKEEVENKKKKKNSLKQTSVKEKKKEVENKKKEKSSLKQSSVKKKKKEVQNKGKMKKQSNGLSKFIEISKDKP